MNTSVLERTAPPTTSKTPRHTATAPPTESEPTPAFSPAALSHVLTVPAVRGQMGDTVYYTANFPVGMIVKLLTYDPDKMSGLPVEDRHQRALQKNRIPEIAEYMLQDDYVFSSITVSVNTDGMTFTPSGLDENIGILGIPMEADWIVNDGQHRVAGMALAVAKDNSLRHDTISLMILPDEGLERSQQVFSDLNRTVQKTSKSLDILFDKRSPINRIANSLVETVPLFKGKVDKEKPTLTPKSPYFATLSTVQSSVQALFAHLPDGILVGNFDGALSITQEFWDAVTELVTPWGDIASGRLEPPVARADYLSGYAVMLTAVASAGSSALQSSGWLDALAPLKDIDYRKSNPEWQNRGMIGDDVVARITTRRALAAFLKEKMQLPPEPVEQAPPTPPPARRRGRPPKNRAA